jgi:DNA-binding transcriptional ArsR family regulator
MTELRKLQTIFHTLSDYNRLSIVRSICDNECSVGEIVATTQLSQPLVSHHLKVLKQNDFLQTKRKGPFIFYSLKDSKILYAIDLFLEIFKDSDMNIEPGHRFCPDRIVRKHRKNLIEFKVE